jgi:hypothetical protein
LSPRVCVPSEEEVQVRSTVKLAALASSVTLAIAPAAALAAGPGHGKPSTEPRHHTVKPKGEAFGVLCQGESKLHVKGEKGTAFSRCVEDMARLAKGEVKTPPEACKNESKRHVAGEKGTAFSRCVSGAEKLLKALREQSGARK